MRKFLLLIFLLYLCSCVFADIQISNYEVTPKVLKPGVSGSVSFSISNTDNQRITGLMLKPAGYGFEFNINQIDVGEIGAGGSTLVSIPFKIMDRVKAGVLILEISGYWTTSTDTGVAHKRFFIPIPVTDPPKFQILNTYSNKEEVSAGEEFLINCTLKNTGGKGVNIFASINSTYFLLIGSSHIPLGEIDKGEEILITLPIKALSSAPSGIHQIPITISYEDELGDSGIVVVSAALINVIKSAIDFAVNTQIDKKTIVPGDKILLTVNLTNTGNENAYSVRVSLSANSTYFTSIGPSERRCEFLASGESKVFEFELGISEKASPAYYPLTLLINSLNKYGESHSAIEKVVGIEVRGEPALEIIVDTTPSPITLGKNTLSLQVSNVGSIPIKALTISLSSEKFPILSSPIRYIGSLRLDEYSSVDYDIYISEDTPPGKYPLHINLSFLDAYNDRQSVEKEVYIEVVQPEIGQAMTETMAGTGGIDIGLIAVIFIFIVLLIGYYFYRKRKSK